MIKFCSKADEAKIRVVLIMAQYKNKWIFCKNNTRYECPGGHVEKNEYYSYKKSTYFYIVPL